MNIVFLLRYWPVYGGGETVTRLLANKLTELGHTIAVVYLWEKKQDDMPFINQNIKKYKIPGVSLPYGEDGIKKSNYKIITNVLHKYFEENNTDIIIDQWIPAKVVYRAKKRTNAKLICCHHTNVHIRPVSRRVIHKLFFALFKEKGRHLYILKTLRPKYKYSDKLIMLCDAFIEDCKALLKASNDDNKICAIPNPLSYEEVIPKDEIEKKEKELLFVGRILDAVKRISFIIDIWKRLQSTKQYDNWKLTIVGDGPDINMLKDYAARLKCTNIYFDGYRNPLMYYRRASIFLMTSLFEGWGMTLLEAQQNGCVPVVMDSFQSLHEIIQYGINGLIIPNNDLAAFAEAVGRLMDDNELRLKLAYKGMETCRRFSIDNVIRHWERIFEEMAGR
jgi:glycosyltransferase involved in cell wall biosynthesis